MSLHCRLNHVLLLDDNLANEKFDMEGVQGGRRGGAFCAGEMRKTKATIQPN